MKTTALSPEHYRNAIYLDFEGEGKKRDGKVSVHEICNMYQPMLNDPRFIQVTTLDALRSSQQYMESGIRSY